MADGARKGGNDLMFERTESGGFRTTITTPTLTVEFSSGRGIFAMYDHGMTETEAREFCERLIARLDERQSDN